MEANFSSTIVVLLVTVMLCVIGGSDPLSTDGDSPKKVFKKVYSL